MPFRVTNIVHEMCNYWRKPGGGLGEEAIVTRKIWTIFFALLFITCLASVADARVVAGQGQPETAGNGNQGDKPGNGNQGSTASASRSARL